MKSKSSVGSSGVFRFIRVRVDLERENVGFDDLFENIDGEWLPRDGVEVVEDRSATNKWTKRGLSALMNKALIGMNTGTDKFYPSSIDDATSQKNPFLAFFIAGDDGTTDADKKVKWDESDAGFDIRIPLHLSVPGEGRRGILLTDTSGPGLKRISTSYMSISPYRNIEYIFFAQANTPTYSTGSVTVVTGSSMVDGETFTLNDGVNPAITFEFDSNGSVSVWDGDPSNNVPIVFASGDADTAIRDAAVEAINQILDVDLKITAAAGSGGVVNLTHDSGGALGAIAITTSASPAFSVSGMTGGSALEGASGNDDEIDNLLAKSVGFAAGVDCGVGEVDNQVGIRSVLGLKPTLKGYGDRIYYHEASSLHKYVSGETLGSVGLDGYTVGDDSSSTGELASTIRTISSDSSDTITASNDELFCKDGDFSNDDVGRTVSIVGATNNSGDHEIKSVITKQRVVLVTNITLDDTSWTSTTIKDANLGLYGFDGNVESDITTDVVDLGRSFRSYSSTLAHILGRVWNTAPSNQIVGIRIVGDMNVSLGNVPEDFVVQYLDAQQVGGPGSKGSLNPYNNSHWTTIDSAHSSQGSTIYAGDDRGLEILFTSPPPQADTFGIRLSSMKSVSGAAGTSSSVVIAELMIFGQRGVISLSSGVNDKMSIALDGTPASSGVPGPVGSLFKVFELGNVLTTGSAANDDMNTIADAINDQVLGYGIEAERTELGFLAIKSTVAGDETQMDLDSDSNLGGKSCNSVLGFQANAGTQTQAAGKTVPWQKMPGEAMTIIYRAEISGDR